MKTFRHQGRRDDPRWAIAAKTQIFPADDETVAALTEDVQPGRSPLADGLLVAQRHPTGWFVHAVRRASLDSDQVPLFRELVTVRTYVLLAHGPQAPTWRQGPRPGEWRSPAFALVEELAAIDEAMVD